MSDTTHSQLARLAEQVVQAAKLCFKPYSCLKLVSAAIVLWDTVHLERATNAAYSDQIRQHLQPKRAIVANGGNCNHDHITLFIIAGMGAYQLNE